MLKATDKSSEELFQFSTYSFHLFNSNFRAFFFDNTKFEFDAPSQQKKNKPQQAMLIVTQHLLSAGSDVIIKNAWKFELLYIDKFLEYVLKR